MRQRIGIDLGGTKIFGVVLNADGSIADEARVATPRGSYEGTLSAIAGIADQLDPAGRLKIGVGTPGAWLSGPGRMQNCNSTWLNGKPLGIDLSARLGSRVRLANDADCFALSEASAGGAAAGLPTVFGVILGTGVGGGIVVDGHLLSGPNGLAGEWGHTPLPYRDSRFASRRCYCGRLDCIETFLCGSGLLQTHLALWSQEGPDEAPASVEALYQRADPERAGAEGWLEGTPAQNPASRAGATLSLYCRLLAASLAQMVNVFDPHAIVLGGGLSNMIGIYEPVTRIMREYVFGEVCETRVLPPAWGDTSGVRGAAWLWPLED